MEQPLTQHWQSEAGYYTVLLTPDLFGGWVLITASGKREGRAGRVLHKPVESYAKGVESIQKMRQRRRREGYALCSSGFMEFNDLDPHSTDTRSAEAEAILRVFEHWDLPLVEQAAILDVRPKAIESYRDTGVFSDEPNLLQRANHLLAIHKALRVLHGGDQGLARAWIRQPNARFDEARPLDLMMCSQEGLKLIRRYLESEADAVMVHHACACPSHERGTSAGL